MKNITLSVDEATYQRARVAAAQRGTSVSALVREYLRGLHDTGRRPEGWQELWAELDAAGAEVGDRPERKRTYDERRFP